MKLMAFTLGLATVGTLMLGLPQTALAADDCPNLQAAVDGFKQHSPKTHIDSMKCAPVAGLYEIIAGDNVVYTDQTGSKVIVGAIFDLDTGTDLTAPVLSKARGGAVVSKLERGEAVGPQGAAQPTSGAGSAVAPEHVSFADFHTPEGKPLQEIVWGKIGAKQKVAVFADPNCPICQRASAALARMDVEVHEYPFNIFPQSTPGLLATLCGDKSKQASEIQDLYDGAKIDGQSCDAGQAALKDIYTFAQSKGWNGTPVFVRADGAVMRGMRDAATLKQFLSQQS